MIMQKIETYGFRFEKVQYGRQQRSHCLHTLHAILFQLATSKNVVLGDVNRLQFNADLDDYLTAV